MNVVTNCRIYYIKILNIHLFIQTLLRNPSEKYCCYFQILKHCIILLFPPHVSCVVLGKINSSVGVLLFKHDTFKYKLTGLQV